MSSTQAWLYGAWLVLICLFVVVTGVQMPPTVASHFVGSGEADAFMSRAGYLGAMCFFAAGIPAVMVFFTRRMIHRAPQRVNLPNRAYWLAPERREATLAAITVHMMWFGFGMSLLIAFAHWEVIQANLREPPRLDSMRVLVAIGLFMAATAWWLVRLYARFRRP
jgi:serine/threonine-protein kinase